MNVRKFQLELMRAILRTSQLEYDDAFQMVKSITMQLAPSIEHAEREKQAIVELKKKELEEKKRELKKIGTGSI